MWELMGYIMQDTAGTLDISWDDTFVCYIVNTVCLSFAISVAGLQGLQSFIFWTSSTCPQPRDFMFYGSSVFILLFQITSEPLG